MKKTIKILFGLAILFAAGCTDKMDMRYGKRDCVYFQNFIYNSQGDKVAFDSLFYSFGNKMSDVKRDTVRIVVCFSGRTADHDRTYRVIVAEKGEVKTGVTTMEVGKDYEPLNELGIIPANSWTDTLEVVLNRDYLDPSHRKQLSKSIVLRLEETADFGVKDIDNSECKLVVNNYLTEPAWWASKTYLGYYHPIKWQVLISFNKDFDNADVLPRAITNYLIQSTYAPALRKWLDANKPVDTETNEYILMDAPVPVGR